MKIGPRYYESLKGMDLEEIQAVELGPQGFQHEAGFRMVEDAMGDDGLELPAVVVIPVFAILCASDQHHVPQYRYVSPYELARGRLEVADRIYAVRIDVADQDLSELVVGRRDDLREEARDNAPDLIVERVARFIVKAARGPFERVAGLAARLPGLIGRALGID